MTDDQLDEFLNSASSYYLELENVDACLGFWEKAVSMRPGNKSYKEELDSYRSSAADESYAKADELLEAGTWKALPSIISVPLRWLRQTMTRE